VLGDGDASILSSPWTGADHPSYSARSGRRRVAAKRGRTVSKVNLDQLPELGSGRARELMAFDDALTALPEVDPRKARIIEPRFFSGLSVQKTAEVLKIFEHGVAALETRARLAMRRSARLRMRGARRLSLGRSRCPQPRFKCEIVPDCSASALWQGPMISAVTCAGDSFTTRSDDPSHLEENLPLVQPVAQVPHQNQNRC
jgi:ECF sigma factor